MDAVEEQEPGTLGRWQGSSGHWCAHSGSHIVRVLKWRRGSRGNPWTVQIWSKYLPTGEERVLLRYWEVVHQEDCATFRDGEEAARQWLHVVEVEHGNA